ncbi:MAG: HepT-like ribonuclease domain-containing protein [Candidatus Firestonebacteria bacterium]
MVPLGVDKEKLFLQLNRLEELLIQLENVKKSLLAKEKEFILIPAIERLLQISIEECINIGNHIISGLMLKRADSYKEVFAILREADILSKDTGAEMESFAKFRNKLVHLYWVVDKEELYAKLEQKNIIKSFVIEITKYLNKKLP